MIRDQTSLCLSQPSTSSFLHVDTAHPTHLSRMSSETSAASAVSPCKGCSSARSMGKANQALDDPLNIPANVCARTKMGDALFYMLLGPEIPHMRYVAMSHAANPTRPRRYCRAPLHSTKHRVPMDIPRAPGQCEPPLPDTQCVQPWGRSLPTQPVKRGQPMSRAPRPRYGTVRYRPGTIIGAWCCAATRACMGCPASSCCMYVYVYMYICRAVPQPLSSHQPPDGGETPGRRGVKCWGVQGLSLIHI